MRNMPDNLNSNPSFPEPENNSNLSDGVNSDEENLLIHLSEMYEELSTLYQIGDIFGNSVNMESLLESILPFAAKSVDGDISIYISVNANGAIGMEYFYGLSSGMKLPWNRIEREGVLLYCFKKRHTVIVNDFFSDERMTCEFCRKFGIGKIICAPLISQDKIIGFLVVGNPLNMEDFSAGKGKIITAIAQQMANWLNNLYLQKREQERIFIEKQIKWAWDIQMRLFPSTNPIIPGASIAGYSMPARQVGGDYYDFVPFDKNSMGVILADVAGKGVSAALLMTMVKGVCHTFPFGEETISELLSVLNRLLIKQGLYDRLITMIAGVYNYRTRIFRYSNAGHNPFIIYRKSSNSVEEFPSLNLPLGVLEEEDYSVNEVQINPGDAMVIFSDGVVEAKNTSGEEYSEAKLGRFLLKNSTGSAKIILEELFSSLKDFSQSQPQYDDITIVVLKARDQMVE